jgi:glucokinase
MATGGVYLGGGIAPKILPLLKDGQFMQAFLDKGRMQHIVTSMPVRVILNDKTALMGAAHYAALH